MPGLPRDIFRIIGGRIRATRKDRGVKMTIADDVRTAYKVKLNPSYLSKMERGKVAIPLKTMLALADYYKVHPSQWIDPVPEAASQESGFLFENHRLMESLLKLQDLVGQEECTEMLTTYVEQLIKTLGPRSGQSVKAARNPKKWTEKS